MKLKFDFKNCFGIVEPSPRAIEPTFIRARLFK